MAEYSQAGILTALLLFTVVTVRDIYFGSSLSQQQQKASGSPGPELDGLRDSGNLRVRGGRVVYTGPMLKFQYCKVFQEYSRAISQLYPDIKIEGDNYPPKTMNKYIANMVSYFKLLVIALIVSGQNPFLYVDMDTPSIWLWSQDNKIFSCLMMFFFSNMVETHFLSTGAFEVTLNDVPIWSKLQSGRIPNVQELFEILDNHLKINQADKIFPTA